MYTSRFAPLWSALISRSRRFARLCPLFLLALSWLSGTTTVQADDVDPPTRVARLSYISGDVSVQLAEANEWVAARINRPLINNDQLWTNDGARAELQVGTSSIQIDDNTQLTVLDVSDNVLQVQLTQGTVIVYVRGMENDETVEVDTPNSATAIQEPGTYRVQTDSSGELTVVQVRNGSAEVSGERQSFSLRENEQVALRGTTRLAAEFDELGRLDEFDRWANARNARGNHVIASQYVSADVVGYEDLDDYGYWAQEPDYGQVWIPTRVVAGWAPYRYGHWEWIPPWGWTWIDDAPWGFAPFHYGRWAYTRDRWCWVPGPRAARAVYAPALVAWVGTPGLNVSVSVSSGPVGWVPLGPHEIYRPSYRVSPGYVERVNISNSLVRRDEFVQRYREPSREVNFVNRTAITVVPVNALRSAQPVNRNLVRTDARDFKPLEGQINVQPERRAIVGGARPVAPPSKVITREVVARRAPTPIARTGAQENSAPPAARNNIRVIEPSATIPGRPFKNDRRDNAVKDVQPANGQPPGRVVTRPQDAPTPDRQISAPADANRQENSRTLENNNDRVRRGFVSPRAETPATPNVQRAVPAPTPEQRQPVMPRVEDNPVQRPTTRVVPTPELRRAPELRQPREQVAPQQNAPAPPRAEQPMQRVEPRPQQVQPQQQRVQPQTQQPQQNRSNDNNNDEERRRRRIEKDNR